MSKKKIKPCNRLKDKDIYSIIPDAQLYDECKKCRCISCAWWYDECRTCAVCLFEARPFTKCMNYEPYILATEPYKSHLKEMEKNRDKIRMYID